MSSEREAAKAGFLRAAGLGDARRQPLSGDASTRAYERLWRSDGSSLIFMDQPPSLETAPCRPGASDDERIALGYNAMARLAAGRVEAFIACAQHLTSLGLSAPRVIAADAAAGLAVLEDLGDGLYARLIEDGTDEAALYGAAIDALVVLHEAAAPNWFQISEPFPPGGGKGQGLGVEEVRPGADQPEGRLANLASLSSRTGATPIPGPSPLQGEGRRWPLLTYDALALETAAGLFVEWLPKLRPDVDFGADAAVEWRALWAPTVAMGAAGASVFCHRDYHAENLIWLPERQGAARVGMLDFQDAVKAHPAWDLSMLLHDARRQVSPALEAACLDRYFAARPGADRARFMAEFHALGALNIVRILGIFARLVTRDRKPRYAQFMPRLWGYLDRCLAEPSLAGVRAFVERAR